MTATYAEKKSNFQIPERVQGGVSRYALQIRVLVQNK